MSARSTLMSLIASVFLERDAHRGLRHDGKPALGHKSHRKQYASGGPRRRPKPARAWSVQRAPARGRCECPRPAALVRIDREPMTSERRMCSRCWCETRRVS